MFDLAEPAPIADCEGVALLDFPASASLAEFDLQLILKPNMAD